MWTRTTRGPTRRQLGAVLAAVAAAAGTAGFALAQASTEPSIRQPSPRIVRVSYVPRYPFGETGRRPGLVVYARDPDGQIVAVFAQPGGVADGACGLGGRANGEVARYALPIRAPRPGRHRVRVTVESAPCDGGATGLQRASRTVTVTVGDRRPSGPPPRSAEVAPPPAWVATRARSAWLAYGSSCWTQRRPDGTAAGMCVDTIAPEQRTDLPTLVVRHGETVAFHVGFTPRQAQLDLGESRAVTLAPGRRMTWRVRGRPRTLTLLAYPRGGGDASYVARVRVR